MPALPIIQKNQKPWYLNPRVIRRLFSVLVFFILTAGVLLFFTFLAVRFMLPAAGISVHEYTGPMNLGFRLGPAFSYEDLAEAAESVEATTLQDSNKIAESELDRILKVLNNFAAKDGVTYKVLWQKLKSLQPGQLELKEKLHWLIEKLGEFNLKLNRTLPKAVSKNRMSESDKPVVLATTACGSSSWAEARTMFKSAIIFSQHTRLHAIIFTDKGTVLEVAFDLFCLKWTADRRLGMKFSFELHLDHFPPDTSKINWRSLWLPCASQRLFMPKLLPHVDAVIYLDADTIVVSNLSDPWNLLKSWKDKPITIAASPNSEDTRPGVYVPGIPIPYVGKRGINSGVLLMGLSKLRQFKLDERSAGVMTAFKEKINYGDQDIINILFSAFPEKIALLNCSYNFNWIHCSSGGYNCTNSTDGSNFCFCKAALSEGVRIVHGNLGTFRSNDTNFAFLPALYKTMNEFDILQDDALTVFENLKRSLDELPTKPCKPLSGQVLYGNAIRYLNQVPGSPLPPDRAVSMVLG